MTWWCDRRRAHVLKKNIDPQSAYQLRVGHTNVSGRASGFSFDIIFHICHLSFCQFEESGPFSTPGPVASAVSTILKSALCWDCCGIWGSCWDFKREGVEWEIWVSLRGREQLREDKLSVLTWSNGHSVHPVLCAKLSELTAPDWLLIAWCNNNNSGCLCSRWSSGPLLQRVTGGCGLHSETPNDICVALTGSLLLPWWLLSPSDEPYESHSDTSPRYPGRKHSLASSIYSISKDHLEQHVKWIQLPAMPVKSFPNSSCQVSQKLSAEVSNRNKSTKRITFFALMHIISMQNMRRLKLFHLF